MISDIELLKNGERVDDLQLDGLRIIQHPDYFAFGTDAVLLSNFAQVHKGQRHLDLCTGSGIVPILLTSKTKGESFAGVEILEYMAGMAARSVALNGLCGKLSIVKGDLRDKALFPKVSFDVITANPPYMPVGGGAASVNDHKAIARHEVMCKLEDVIEAASRLLVPNGKFYMIHRPSRLGEIFSLFERYGLAAKVLQFVHPRVGEAPNLVLVQATKGGSLMDIKFKEPLVVHG
ncbi:MAG: tRNA1(Val) (adenine(37)-N6)-methyltransferase [Defluviitaleaceae bacterium]|nr:tRNA1(Val) (adenine(37)-N6)-methyltransferase [Defluviitaleaceae bacterium]